MVLMVLMVLFMIYGKYMNKIYLLIFQAVVIGHIVVTPNYFHRNYHVCVLRSITRLRASYCILAAFIYCGWEFHVSYFVLFVFKHDI